MHRAPAMRRSARSRNSKNDVYEVAPGVNRRVTGITLSRSANAKGGTGGYGRVINDNGDVAVGVSMNQNTSGVFVLVP